MDREYCVHLNRISQSDSGLWVYVVLLHTVCAAVASWLNEDATARSNPFVLAVEITYTALVVGIYLRDFMIVCRTRRRRALRGLVLNS